MEFKNMYVVVVIVVLLFGVGLGYQINTWVNDKSETANSDTNTATTGGNTQTGQIPQSATEIFSRSGKVESVAGDSITLITHTQNTDSTFSKLTITAAVDADTSITKIDLRETNKEETTIALSDISVGSEVAVYSDENVYGKTSFTASRVQLHVF